MSGEILVAEADNGHGFRDMKFAFLCFDDRAMGQEIRATEHHATGKALIVPEFAQSATALCEAGRAGRLKPSLILPPRAARRSTKAVARGLARSSATVMVAATR